MTNLLKHGDKIGKLQHAAWISKGTDTEYGHSFSHSQTLECTQAGWRSISTPKASFVSLKHLLNESVFPLAAQSNLEKEHSVMSVSICYCQSLPHSLLCVYCLLGACFIHFLWAKAINLPPGWGAVCL